MINRSLSGVEKEEVELVMDENSFTLYPNPVKSQNEIIIESEELIESVSISDISGKNSVNYMQINQYSYKLPIAYNEAYHLTGDGVAVPAVRHLAKHIFEPILDCNHSEIENFKVVSS